MNLEILITLCCPSVFSSLPVVLQILKFRLKRYHNSISHVSDRLLGIFGLPSITIIRACSQQVSMTVPVQRCDILKWIKLHSKAYFSFAISNLVAGDLLPLHLNAMLQHFNTCLPSLKKNRKVIKMVFIKRGGMMTWFRFQILAVESPEPEVILQKQNCNFSRNKIVILKWQIREYECRLLRKPEARRSCFGFQAQMNTSLSWPFSTVLFSTFYR